MIFSISTRGEKSSINRMVRFVAKRSDSFLMSLEMLRDTLKPTCFFSISEGKLFFWLLMSVAESGISQMENYSIPIWSVCMIHKKTAESWDFGLKEAPADCWIYIYPPPPLMSYDGLWDWHIIVVITIFIIFYQLFQVSKWFAFSKNSRQLFRPEVRT